MSELPSQIENRKDDHVRISLREDVEAKDVNTGFEEALLVHQATPEIDRSKISLTTEVFGHKFSAPILVGAMTGGTNAARKINSTIAQAVEELGLGMGVGSQRAALTEPKYEPTYGIAREKAPTAFLVANIGAPQLVEGYGIKDAMKAVEMIEADALAIHLNPLQEAIQPEGETNYFGVLKKIEEISDELQVPIIAKETGAGISAEAAKKLEQAGVLGIDVSGAGGTSWAAVEYYRAKERKDALHERLGKIFWDWGIPTVASLIEVRQNTQLDIIASGGVRAGTDAAKAIVLGASLASMSVPILRAVTGGIDEVKSNLTVLIEELKNAMFLVGAGSVKELENAPIVLTGRIAEWLERRGFEPNKYARRAIR